MLSFPLVSSDGLLQYFSLLLSLSLRFQDCIVPQVPAWHPTMSPARWQELWLGGRLCKNTKKTLVWCLLGDIEMKNNHDEWEGFTCLSAELGLHPKSSSIQSIMHSNIETDQMFKKKKKLKLLQTPLLNQYGGHPPWHSGYSVMFWQARRAVLDFSC